MTTDLSTLTYNEIHWLSWIQNQPDSEVTHSRLEHLFLAIHQVMDS